MDYDFNASRGVDDHCAFDLCRSCMSDHLQELTAFVRAAETGSFWRVAREFGVSQPSVSRMVASLEARLGVKLLLRTTRQVTPTDAGSVLLERARQVLGDLEDAENAAREIDSLGVFRGRMCRSLGTLPIRRQNETVCADHFVAFPDAAIIASGAAAARNGHGANHHRLATRHRRRRGSC